MIIPDTSIWVDLFRGGQNLLATEPELARRRLLHPFVYGELLLGGLPKDRDLRAMLAALRPAPVAEVNEVVAFIQWAKLAGTGIGYVDAHLLVSAKMIGGSILTLDNDLQANAERLGVAYDETPTR